jgi:hypothetical protein
MGNKYTQPTLIALVGAALITLSLSHDRQRHSIDVTQGGLVRLAGSVATNSEIVGHELQLLYDRTQQLQHELDEQRKMQEMFQRTLEWEVRRTTALIKTNKAEL